MSFPRKVYMIRHNVTGRVYIGSSSNISRRWGEHMRALKHGNHSVGDMQNDYNQYGDDFTFTVLDTMKNYNERNKEFLWMQKFNSYERGVGYNYQDRTNPKSEGRKKVDDLKEVYIRKIERFIHHTDNVVLLSLISKLIDEI